MFVFAAERKDFLRRSMRALGQRRANAFGDAIASTFPSASAIAIAIRGEAIRHGDAMSRVHADNRRKDTEDMEHLTWRLVASVGPLMTKRWRAGAEIYEQVVLDTALPRKPSIVPPVEGGVHRKRFWVPANTVATVALCLALRVEREAVPPDDPASFVLTRRSRWRTPLSERPAISNQRNRPLGRALAFAIHMLLRSVIAAVEPGTFAQHGLWVPVNALGVIGAALVLLGLPAMYARMAGAAGLPGLLGIVLLSLAWMFFGLFLSLYSALVLPWSADDALSLVGAAAPLPAALLLAFIGALVAWLAGTVLFAIPFIRRRMRPRWVGYVLPASAIWMAIGSLMIAPSGPASNLLDNEPGAGAVDDRCGSSRLARVRARTVKSINWHFPPPHTGTKGLGTKRII